MILNAVRTVEDTQSVGIEITQELVRNREKIESARGHVRNSPFLIFNHKCYVFLIIACFVFMQAKTFTGLTDTARRTLNSMSNRDLRQKYILAGLSIMLIVAIVLVTYYSTAGSSSS